MKNIKNPLLLLILSVIFSSFVFGSDHKPGTLIVKIKPQYLNLCHDTGVAIPGFYDEFLGQSPTFIRKFPNAVPPVFRNAQAGVELRTIYEITLPENTDLNKLINALSSSPHVAYAEKKYINKLTFTPNDSRYGDQGYLQLINAENAWDIQKGDTSVVIAIVDNGTTLEHPDLRNKLALNYADPINGSDSDNNGFVDDYYGWDFVNNDHIPEHREGDDHGVHVAGIAAAETNNGTGVASIGFQSRYLPVKTGEGSFITYGYEGVVYAADRGADIINCSWGSFSPSAFAQDVMTYATVNQDALVIAASGNNGLNTPFFPAALENVLSVASVSSNGTASGFSNHGYWVDIAAPGQDILSTIPGGYKPISGTSMAAPVVAGAAALVKAQFPNISPGQITARLKSTASAFNNLNPGDPLFNRMGAGIVNPHQALQGTLTQPWFELAHVLVSDSIDDFYTAGDTLRLTASFVNYLDTSEEVEVKITPNNQLTPLKNSIQYGIFATSQQRDNRNEPFELVINPTQQRNKIVTITFELSGGSHTQEFYYDLIINPTFINVNVNRVATTATSVGRVGYNKRETDAGLGFILGQGRSMLYSAGFMVGGINSSGDTMVVDVVRNDPNLDDRDFEPVSFINRDLNAPETFWAQNIFSDTVTSQRRNDSLGLEVKQTVTAYNDFGHDQYVFFEYEVKNIGSRTITQVNLGMLADWDIANPNRNSSYEMNPYKTAVTKSTQTPLYGAVQLTSGFGFKSYAIDNVTGGGGGVEILDGFTTREKFTTLSTSRPTAGIDENGRDVLQIISSGPYVFAPGTTRKIVFAFFAAHDENDLIRLADSASIRYTGRAITSAPAVSGSDQKQMKIYPNPTAGVLHVQSNNRAVREITITDLSGKSLLNRRLNTMRTSVHTDFLPAGMYFITVKTEHMNEVHRFLKQ